MENNPHLKSEEQIRPDKYRRWYASLDKTLLNLLAGELGYFIFLIAVALVLGAAQLLSDFESGISILWLAGLYSLALPLNMPGGFASLMLNIRIDYQGYPGTGHLLNGMFLMTTGWIFIFVFVFMPISMASTY